MATTVLASDIVRKEWVQSILETGFGCGERDVESFILSVFKGKEEMSFCEFTEKVFMCSNNNNGEIEETNS